MTNAEHRARVRAGNLSEADLNWVAPGVSFSSFVADGLGPSQADSKH